MDTFVIADQYALAISSLTLTELRSVMKRHFRLGTHSSLHIQKAKEQVLKEIDAGLLTVHRIESTTFDLAMELIESLQSPLAALDAIHLACAKASDAELMVCADRQLLRAAAEADLDIFDLSPQRDSH